MSVNYMKEGTMDVTIMNSGETIRRSREVMVTEMRSKLLVQTDKAVYKPGQNVKFRILSINEDLQPLNTVLPVVEIQDPGKNRIGQWLNVNVSQGLAELSLPLSSESPLGEYSIWIQNIVHEFTVEEYVLPKFEVSLQLHKVVMFDSGQIPLRVCGRYTYGKPVNGSYTVTVCQKAVLMWWGRHDLGRSDICVDFTGKLDRLGCHIIEVNSEDFQLKSTDMEQVLRVNATITESGTGIQLSTSSQTRVSNIINKVSFVNADNNYKVGIPYTGVIKVVDVGDNPIPGINVYLTSDDPPINDTLVTDDNGQVSFTLDTNGWKREKMFMATTNLKRPPNLDFRVISPQYGMSCLNIKPFYSRTKSFLKLHSLNRVLACEGQQEVQVEYIIESTQLENATDHLDLHYLVTSKGSIQDSGSFEISIRSNNKGVHGKTTFKLPLSAGKSSMQVVVYTMLPDGDILADSANYEVQKCFKNKVSVGFLPNEVLPGSEVSLQVQAAPGSLCGLRVVDQSVVLMKPDKELTIDKVLGLFPSWQTSQYDIWGHDDMCLPPLSQVPLRPSWGIEKYEGDADIRSSFEGINLKIVTSAYTLKHVDSLPYRFSRLENGVPVFTRRVISPRIDDGEKGEMNNEEHEMELEKNKAIKPIQKYFPETWIWELVSLGDSGSADLHHKAPNTITDWNAGAVCFGQSGFGLSPPASLRVFKPFFVDLTLPNSVVRGETFILKASVFNYLEQCIKIEVTLGPTEELEQTSCTNCDYSSCLCADESKTFYWNLKATNLGDVNITVQTEAVKTEELCQNEIAIVPQQGATNTIVKRLLVQPGGVLVEKSHGSVLCMKEGEDNTRTDKISLKVPKNTLKDSERAYVTVFGDLMGTALHNLDHLLSMPFGCGEQNMVLFAPSIFVLQYLEKTLQLTDEIKTKAIKFLENGYRHQLRYKRNDGSYSGFGEKDDEGNTWLTAFVVKSFSKARPYIFIDESLLNESFTWLKTNRNEDGCFRRVGSLFNNAMKGGVEDDISLSAYVTISLIEGGVPLEDPLVRDAVSCLQKSAKNVKNVYTLALLAYTFTLCGETEFRKTILDKLEEKAVRGDRELHWKRDSDLPKQDSYWDRAPSAEVEMTAYCLLALLYGPDPYVGKTTHIANWLRKQQNPYGGFSSTQDTVVALQALAKYAALTFGDKGDLTVTVTVTSSTGFLEKFHVDKNNRLLPQRATLPTVTGEYMVTATGNGCVFVQTALRYNVSPPRIDTSFSLAVTPRLTRECLGHPVTNFDILISATYIGTRERSNMAIIEVKMLSGYIPEQSTLMMLQKDQLIQRSEIQMDKVILYLNQVGHDPINLSFKVKKTNEVKNLKPATAKVYDYYETDEQALAEYNHPCKIDDKFINSS